MKEQLITFETAKLVKEKGFTLKHIQIGFDYYKPDGEKLRLDEFNKEFIKYCTPYYTQSLLQKWLREVHQIYVQIEVDRTTYPKFWFEVIHFTGNPLNLSEREWGWESKYTAEFLYRTYEEALEEGLQEGLKLIK